MKNDKLSLSNKDIVLQTAAALFLTKGYLMTSMDEIVALSKVSKTNIYYHYKSKEELLLAIIDQLVSHYEQRITRVLAQDMSIPAKLERLFQILTEDHEQDDCVGGCPFLTLYTQTSNSSLEARAKIRTFFDKQLQVVEKLLEEGIAKKELSQDLPVRQTAALIVTSIEGALFLTKVSDNPMLVQNLFQSLTSVLK
ncbi:TetR/AcrR family transcriptional regulator [Paenibacillus oralis]|uniref:TetR/AcrR family transcriptional regulator n=1 Tax=Paenibacillus oralis TaxID=2490856 RepID=A0A3P3U2J2_9BACL|nr:TetR/AcrR family transcriptional regulator [Paenibacillus oralis]RRJ62793.1 TetR/AcrR family transcriptional regulator [Paenibacillus oralis]